MVRRAASRNLAPRILAVVLSVCLILPPHAYALRPQQREAEPQRAGLEEALRSGDPEALIRVASSRLAQWIAPAPAAVPGLSVEGSSAVPIGQIRAGLEEAQRIAKQYGDLLAELSEKPDQPVLIAQLKGEMADPSKKDRQVIAAQVLVEQMGVDLADPDYYYQLDRSNPEHPVYRAPRPEDRGRIQGERQEAVETRLAALEILKENERLLPLPPNDLKDYIDLQVHTFLSDGSKSPSAVIFEAWRRGMKVVGINDHNTFDHFEEAIRAGEILGITVYPSIELDLVDPDLWGTAQNAHVLVYFPVRSIQEWETIRGRLEKKRGIDPTHPGLNLFGLAELRLKWNLMKQQEIIRRFNEKYGPRDLIIAPHMTAFRMGGHPNFAMVAAILKANFTATQLKSGIDGVPVKGASLQYDQNWDARELAKKIVRSDPEVYVDFSDPLFSGEGIPTLPGTNTSLFGLSVKVLDPLRQGNFGTVAVLPHPNEEVRFWIDPAKIRWEEVERVTGMNQDQYLARFPLRDGKAWITPAFLKKFHLDGIELSGKKGELPAEEIRKLVDFLRTDPDTFLVTVGSDTHYNEFDEAGGYQLGKGMSLGSDQWSLSKTSVEEALASAGLNLYGEIPQRMRPLFVQRFRTGLEEFEEFRVGSLPIRISKEHDDVYRWLRKLGEGGIVVLGEVDVVNIDPHPDDVAKDQVTPGSWVHFVQKERLAKQVVKVFPTWLSPKFQELFGFKKAHQFSDGVSWEEFRHLSLKRSTIVTIDMDAFAPYVSDDDPGWVFGLPHNPDPWYSLGISRDDFLINNTDIRGWIDQVIEFLKSNRDKIRAVHIARSPGHTDPKKQLFVEETLREGLQSLAGLEEEERVAEAIRLLQRGSDYRRREGLTQVLDWASRWDSLEPSLRESIADRLETLVGLVEENTRYTDFQQDHRTVPKDRWSGQPNDDVGVEPELEEVGGYVRELAGRTLAALRQLPPPAKSGLEEGVPEVATALESVLVRGPAQAEALGITVVPGVKVGFDPSYTGKVGSNVRIERADMVYFGSDGIWVRSGDEVGLFQEGLDVAAGTVISAAGLEEQTKLTWKAWWTTLGHWGVVNKALRKYDRPARQALRGQINQWINRLVEREAGGGARYILRHGIPAVAALRSTRVDFQTVFNSVERFVEKLGSESGLLWRKVSSVDFARLAAEAIRLDEQGIGYKVEVSPEVRSRFHRVRELGPMFEGMSEDEAETIANWEETTPWVERRVWIAGRRQEIRVIPLTGSANLSPPSTGLEEIPVDQLAAEWIQRGSVALDVRVRRLDMPNKEEYAARTNQVPHSYLVYELVHPETGQVVSSMMVGFSPADISPKDVILADVTMDQKLGNTALDVQFLRWIVQNTLDSSVTSLRHRHWEDPEDRDWAIRLSRSEQARQELVDQGRVPFETEPEDIPQYAIRMDRASSAAWKTGNLPEKDVWFRGWNFPLPGAPRIDVAPVTVSVSSPVRTGFEETAGTRLQSTVTSTNVSETRVAVISARAATGTGLEELAGHPRRIGDAWLLVLPSQVTTDRLAELVAPLMDRPNIVFQEYGGLEEFAQLNTMVEGLAAIQGPRALTGTTLLDALRKIVANLSGLEEGAVSEDQIQRVEDALGLGSRA